MAELSKKDIIAFLKKANQEFQAIALQQGIKWQAANFEPTENGNYKIAMPNRPNMGHFLSELPASLEFSQTIQETNLFNSYLKKYTVEKPAWLNSEMLMRGVLDSYFGVCANFEFETELADEVADNFIKSWETGKTSYVFRAVLRGAYGEIEEIKISDDLKIRRMTDSELRRHMEWFTKSINEDALPYNRYILELIRTEHHDDTGIHFPHIISALRLIQPGAVEYETAYQRSKIGEITAGSSSEGYPLHKRPPVKNTYLLTDNVANELLIFYPLFQKDDFGKMLNIALSRLNIAAERVSPEDGILDALIALEAVYGDGQGAIGYKIGMRCAVFLETEWEMRSKIKDDIAKAYSWRSAVVHGSKKKNSFLEAQKQVDQIYDLVRCSIKKILKLKSEGKDIPSAEDFDLALLGKL